MTGDLLGLIAVILILILASAFFSSAETALTAASDARMRQLSGKGNRRAMLVEKLRDDREGLIGSILIGNNAVNVIASALATSVFISILDDAGVVWATITMTVVLVVFIVVVVPCTSRFPVMVWLPCILVLPLTSSAKLPGVSVFIPTRSLRTSR